MTTPEPDGAPDAKRGRGRPRIGKRVHFNQPLDDLRRVDHIVAVEERDRADVLRELVREALDARKREGR